MGLSYLHVCKIKGDLVFMKVANMEDTIDFYYYITYEKKPMITYFINLGVKNIENTVKPEA